MSFGLGMEPLGLPEAAALLSMRPDTVRSAHLLPHPLG